MKNAYKQINLLQHIGVGVTDTDATWKWYRKFFGLNVPMFDSVREAPLMLIYTNNRVVNKRATMVINMQGGSAMEIVQLKGLPTQKAAFDVQLGDLGIYILKVKTKDIAAAYRFFKENNGGVISDIVRTPDNKETFYVKDLNGFIFQIIPDTQTYIDGWHITSGIGGCVLGVSDMDKAKKFYSELLGFDKVLYDKTDVFSDWKNIPGGNSKARRVLLTQGQGPVGAFSDVTGTSHIELVQVFDRTPRKILKDRIWGDEGFLHLAFDVRGMKELEKDCKAFGAPFTCDSKDAINMGDHTEVHCTYIEDPDGTLIEFTEVFKIPILKKIGWYLDVEKRDPRKPLPAWMLKGMRFSKVKD